VSVCLSARISLEPHARSLPNFLSMLPMSVQPDKRLTHFALGLRKHDLRILVGLLSRHCTFNRRLAIMRIQDDPLCPACGEEETPLHLLGKCYATMQTRYRMLGAYTLQLEKLYRISPSCLLRFAKASLWPPCVADADITFLSSGYGRPM